jgi:hypothetical protein
MENVMENLILRLVSFFLGFVAGLLVAGDKPQVKSVGTAWSAAAPVHTSSATKEAP